MGKAKPQVVGDRTFKSKKGLREEIQRILYSTSVGNSVEGEDLTLMLGLIDRHPSKEEKIGVGVASIIVDYSKFGKEVCFYILRQDGSVIDFSFHLCIEGRPSNRQEFNSACRVAVMRDIKEFKEKEFKHHPVICEISGEVLKNDASSHVDHVDPLFNKIVTGFISSNNIDLSSIVYDKSNPITKFADPVVAEDFRKYHEVHARVRVVLAKANLSRKF